MTLATCHGLFGPVDEHGEAAPLEGGEDLGPPGRGVGDPGHLVADGVRGRLGPGDQVGQPVGAVLGLDHQVDGGVGDRRRGVGHHHDLGRPGEGGRHADQPVAGDQSFGDGHVAVAGTDDDIDRRDALGPVGQGGDGLGPADAVHLVDAGDGGRGQDRRGQAAVRAGRRAEGQSADPRDPGRARGHEHGGGQRGPPAGDVQAGPVDRDGQVAHHDARRGPAGRRRAAGCGGRRRCCRGPPAWRCAARPGWRRGRPSPRRRGPAGRRRRRRRTAG